MRYFPYAIDLAVWLELAIWTAGVALMAVGWAWQRYLRDVTLAPDSAPPPRLAVVLAALNEEEGIRAALESLVAQDYPDLRIIPVDDRSTDRTGRIMEEIAAAASAAGNAASPGSVPRVAPLHVRELPPEWLGKNHANWLGAREARRQGAEWILFTDGDVLFAPSALRKAVTYVRDRGLAHLAVAPHLLFRSFGEAVLLSTFLILFMGRFRAWRVEHPRSRGYVGVGAFNLVRVDAYDAIGTHEKLALTVADDVALGKLVRDAGFPRGFLDGRDEVRVRWQDGLVATVRGLYKNCFASLDFSAAKSAVGVAAILFMMMGPFALPWLTAGAPRVAAFVALAALLGVYTNAARQLGRSFPYAVGVACCAWFGGLLMGWILTASTVLTLRQGGIRWRGTLYPTALLRDRQVRV
ncbi:MAG: glycosyltransferase [Planctomycetes bacterium]|nr:glycosyltransferase [Planctomycetota bacterium]